MTDIKWKITAKDYNIRMRFQDSLNEVRKKERMTEGSERESEREREQEWLKKYRLVSLT